MKLTRQHVVDMLQTAGLRGLAEEAGRALPDPVEYDHAENFLAERGVTDFDLYRVDPREPLAQDFFLPDDIPPPPGVATVETYGDRR